MRIATPALGTLLRSLLVMLACVCLISRAAQALDADAPQTPPNTLSSEEQRMGFELLFDGQTDKGWQHAGNWVVEDGTLYRKQRGGDVTYTVAKVPDDFELRFECEKCLSFSRKMPVLFSFSLFPLQRHVD